MSTDDQPVTEDCNHVCEHLYESECVNQPRPCRAREELDVPQLVGEAWDDGNAIGLDGWIGPNRGAGDVDPEAERARARMVDRAHSLPAAPPVSTVVADFIAQREEYVRVLRQTVNADADYHRWQGHAEARRQLADKLKAAPAEAASAQVEIPALEEIATTIHRATCLTSPRFLCSGPHDADRHQAAAVLALLKGDQP